MRVLKAYHSRNGTTPSARPKLDRIIDDIQDLKVRMTSPEEATAGTNRRLDRLEMRLDRIGRRLDLVTP